MKAPPATSAHLEIYDTTLRDGAQAEDVSFSAEDKVMVAQRLDELGVQFIEGGWPGANPKDIEFFRMIKETPLKQATVVAFGSTRKASNPVQKDPNIQALLQAETKVITLFGKSWSLHVTDALGHLAQQESRTHRRLRGVSSLETPPGVLRCGALL